MRSLHLATNSHFQKNNTALMAATLLLVGRSNITFKIFDDSNSYVLRRPPFGDKLESAHNMQREFRIISELSENDIKVPKPILLCTDKKISDDDFYIMEYIEGATIADNVIAENY